MCFCLVNTGYQKEDMFYKYLVCDSWIVSSSPREYRHRSSGNSVLGHHDAPHLMRFLTELHNKLIVLRGSQLKS